MMEFLANCHQFGNYEKLINSIFRFGLNLTPPVQWRCLIRSVVCVDSCGAKQPSRKRGDTQCLERQAFGEAPLSGVCVLRSPRALFQRLIALAADPFRMQNLYFFLPERPLSARSESGAAFAPRARECAAPVCLILLSHWLESCALWRGFLFQSVELKKRFCARRTMRAREPSGLRF